MNLATTVPEVIVWLPTLLDETSRNALTERLMQEPGINAADFCPLREHLLLVQYQGMNSLDVLEQVRKTSIDAKLVGPI